MSDLLLVNGRFHTQDPERPRATAAAIRDGHFRAVGADSEIRALGGPGARIIDLEGRRVLPGLTDAHFHYHDWALGRRRLVLAGVASLERLLDRVSSAARSLRPGAWILGQGWNEMAWSGRRLPSRRDLDGAAPAHPVLLLRSDLHLAVVNSPALEAAGITPGTPDPDMGAIDRDAEGRPTGVLRDLAVNLVTARIPDPPDDEVVLAFRDGFACLHRMGLTGVHDQRLMGGLEGAAAFRAWQSLRREEALNLRVWMNLPGERLDEIIALGLRTGMGDGCLRVGHCKFFADGAQGVGTAWMLEPYEGSTNTGLQLTPMAQIEDALKRAQAAGLALSVHAIGDRANAELAGVFERVLDGRGPTGCAPHRIEHLQLIRPETVRRIARLGVVASVQPVHLVDDLPMMEPTVGARTCFAHTWRTMLEAGLTLAAGSDCPVSDPNPFWGIHAAVTRRRRDGTPAGGWYPEQRLTVAEAVRAFTLGPAIASGRRRDLGSISPGKRADLVVLDRDIFTVDPMEICEAKPVMTLFAGRVVHQTT
jgi:predicted amidohydrolase YtcJ